MRLPANPDHVAVDLDDVVLDFLGGLVAAVNMEHGTSLTREDITQWDLHDVLDPIVGRSFWSWLKDRYWLWSNFSSVPGAMGGLEALRRHGYYLECITSKPEWAEAQVWKWMGKWRPPFHRVTIVGHGDIKANFSDALYLIDDKPQNVNEWANAERVPILFSRPHNVNAVVAREVIRVANWDEATALLKLPKEA